ncbi:MAG: autotransporter outer membrane beta-barrel domain-containing protein [Campylobacteraceae bacterium]|nr:autotransporter outer membrane beta-barrel domain-containing protein [Campylobacteraceae bacterium]
MKKIYLLPLGFLFLAMPLCADDSYAGKSNGLFIGADGGYAFSYTYIDTVLEDQVNGHRYDGYNFDEYDDYGDGVFNYGVKIGWYFKNSNMKAYISYERSSKAKDNDGYSDFSDKTSKVLLGYDAAFAKAGDFRFVVGGTIGYANMKLRIDDYSARYDGVDAGLKVGAIYDLNSHNEIEFGLKTNYSFYEEKTIGNTRISGRTYDVNINPYQLRVGLYTGYNFKF